MNNESGVISGEISPDILDIYNNTIYTVTCKSQFNELKASLHILFINQLLYIPKLGVLSCKCNMIRLMNNSSILVKRWDLIQSATDFSIEPELPEGLMMLENGDIIGETHNQISKKKYKITYRCGNKVHYHFYNISIGELISFFYDKRVYNIKNGEIMDICCHCDGDDCEFSISPELPPSVSFDNKSGRIFGIWDNKYNSKYEITCKNDTNTLKAEIEIRYDKITYFSYKQYYFQFKINENFSIEPETDGENVRYSMESILPEPMKFDEKTGIISGSCDKCKKLNLKVECRNNFTYKECEFTIEFI